MYNLAASKQTNMKTTTNKRKLKEFTIWIPTSFGLGCFKIKAKNFHDAFLKLGKKDKAKEGWIEDESGDSKTFQEIIN